MAEMDATRACVVCGALFAWRANKLYCSRACKDKARDKDLLRASSKAWLKRNPGKASAAKAAYRKRVGRGDRSGEYARCATKRRSDLSPVIRAIARACEPALGLIGALARTIKPKLKPAIPLGRGQSTYMLALRANPERYAAELQRWRAKKLKRKHGKLMRSDGTVNASVLFAGTRCLYCDCRLNESNRTHDHMDPISLGGVNSAANIAPCCHACNSSKGARTFSAFVASLKSADMFRAIKYYEKRNGAVGQIGLGLSVCQEKVKVPPGQFI